MVNDGEGERGKPRMFQLGRKGTTPAARKMFCNIILTMVNAVFYASYIENVIVLCNSKDRQLNRAR